MKRKSESVWFFLCFIFFFIFNNFFFFFHFYKQEFEKERESPECSSPLTVESNERVNLSTNLMNNTLMGTGARLSPHQDHAATISAAAATAAQAHLNGTSEYISYSVSFLLLI